MVSTPSAGSFAPPPHVQMRFFGARIFACVGMIMIICRLFGSFNFSLFYSKKRVEWGGRLEKEMCEFVATSHYDTSSSFLPLCILNVMLCLLYGQLGEEKGQVNLWVEGLDYLSRG